MEHNPNKSRDTKQHAIILQRIDPENKKKNSKKTSVSDEALIEEATSLLNSANIEVVKTFTQERLRGPKYMGVGKLEEVKAFIDQYNLDDSNDTAIDIVLVNDSISASELNYIDQLIDIKIIDRTQLILDIFASRAESNEGKIQVELAQLSYLLPRLSGHGKSLSRQAGGIGARGPGETKLEQDQRHIRSRMNELKRKLSRLETMRMRRREKDNRQSAPKVALVGYTNAGKSSWFNVLTQAMTYEDDLLFATLDTLKRDVQLNEHGFSMKLIDTVGFIRELPTELVEAFKSTLEEAMDSDILLIVIDSSDDAYMEHYDTVTEIIGKIMPDDEIERIVIMNKSDVIERDISSFQAPTISVSSQLDDGKVVKDKILDVLRGLYESYTVTIPIRDSNTLYTLKQQTIIESIDIDEVKERYIINGFISNKSLLHQWI